MKRYNNRKQHYVYQHKAHRTAFKWWAIQLGAHTHSAISERPGKQEGLGHRPFKHLGNLLGVGRCCVSYY